MNAAESGQLDSLARASRRTALLGLLGALFVLASLLYSAYRLRGLERQVATTRQQIDSLQAQARTLQEQLDSTRARLGVARRALEDAAISLSRSEQASHWIRRGINRYQRGEYAEAVRAYREALKTDSTNHFAYAYMGYAYYRSKRYPDAIHSLREAVRHSPEYDRGYYNLALAEWYGGSRLEALRSLGKAVTINPALRDTIRQDRQFAELLRSPEAQSLVF